MRRIDDSFVGKIVLPYCGTGQYAYSTVVLASEWAAAGRVSAGNGLAIMAGRSYISAGRPCSGRWQGSGPWKFVRGGPLCSSILAL